MWQSGAWLTHVAEQERERERGESVVRASGRIGGVLVLLCCSFHSSLLLLMGVNSIRIGSSIGRLGLNNMLSGSGCRTGLGVEEGSVVRLSQAGNSQAMLLESRRSMALICRMTEKSLTARASGTERVSLNSHLDSGNGVLWRRYARLLEV